MKAFHSVRAEMREACLGLTSPVPGRPGDPAQVIRAEEEAEPDTHIEPWMEVAFHCLTHASETGEPFALISCFMNGEPAVIIAAARSRGRRTEVTPLFMAVQPWMSFSEHPSDEGDEGGEVGGGPARNASDPPAPR